MSWGSTKAEPSEYVFDINVALVYWPWWTSKVGQSGDFA